MVAYLRVFCLGYVWQKSKMNHIRANTWLEPTMLLMVAPTFAYLTVFNATLTNCYPCEPSRDYPASGQWHRLTSWPGERFQVSVARWGSIVIQAKRVPCPWALQTEHSQEQWPQSALAKFWSDWSACASGSNYFCYFLFVIYYHYLFSRLPP